MRVGILGGTFDPVHLGHLAMAEEARIQLGLDTVLFLPAGQPWLKEGQKLTPASERAHMVSLAIASNPHFQLCLDEIDRPGVTYTVDTLETLVKRLDTDTQLYFIVGRDVMDDFHRWKEPERLLELCKLVVVDRPGSEVFDVSAFMTRYAVVPDGVKVLTMPQMGISGRELRKRAKSGMSLRYHTPDAVAEYIKERPLYAC